VFALVPAVQKYAWGKPGPESTVAQLAQCSIDQFIIDPNTTYAEVIHV
jgi:mannose-6-phosphate isomerase class I